VVYHEERIRPIKNEVSKKSLCIETQEAGYHSP